MNCSVFKTRTAATEFHVLIFATEFIIVRCRVSVFLCWLTLHLWQTFIYRGSELENLLISKTN